MKNCYIGDLIKFNRIFVSKGHFINSIICSTSIISNKLIHFNTSIEKYMFWEKIDC